MEKNPKIHVEPKRLWIAKAIMSKKNKTSGIATPYFKIYYGAVVTKALWHQHKSRRSGVK